MKDETKIWLEFSIENLKSAKVLLDSDLYNPALQNIQQAIEKALKAIFVERSIIFKRTHSITELNNLLLERNIDVSLSNDGCEFIDSIYLPSKYPVSQVLPDFEPTKEICKKGIKIAESVLKIVQEIINKAS